MICVSIIEQNKRKCLDILQQVEMAELRFDLIRPNINTIKEYFKFNIPIIATCREGFYKTDERLQILKTAIDCGAAYIDVELESDDKYRLKLETEARKNDCKMIISYHNYNSTPSLEALHDAVSDARSCGCDYAKIVTTAHNEQDVARVLSLYETEKNIIAFAMGKSGKISRLTSLKLGAPFVYAAFDVGSESADGQMSLHEVQEILKIMR